jgi:hypothetical protein
MIGWFSKKATSPVGGVYPRALRDTGAADLSSQGEVKGAEPHLPLRGRGRHTVAGEGALPSPTCAIWNDIARALDSKPKVIKGGAK